MVRHTDQRSTDNRNARIYAGRVLRNSSSWQRPNVDVVYHRRLARVGRSALYSPVINKVGLMQQSNSF